MSEFDSDSYHVKTYDEGVEVGERRGRQQGYSEGLTVGRSECYLQKQAEKNEEERKATLEAHRVFWDTAFLQDPKIKEEEKQFDPKAEAGKAESNMKAFIADVQVMTPNELLATEKELVDKYADKQTAWKKHHGWFESKPVNPMKVNRGDSGSITSIEFPRESYTIPVTYWNSQVEANRVQDLSTVVQNASNPMERSVALKALADELATLKPPQIAQMEARKH